MKTSGLFKFIPLILILLFLAMTGCQHDNPDRKARQENPEAAALLLKSGVKHLENRELQQARRDLETAAGLSPRDPDIFVVLGDVYDELYMLKEAEAAFNKAISLSPRNSEAHWAFGMIFYQMDKYREAESALKAAIKLDTACGKAFYDLGHIYLRQGKIVEAEEAYKNSIKREPGNPCTYIGMGEFLTYRGRLDEAVVILNKALKVNEAALKQGKTKSEEGHIRTALGNAYRVQKKYSEAGDQLQKAAKADPGVVGSYYVMGELMLDMNKLEEASSWLEKAIKINPYDRSFFVTLADIRIKQGNLRDAETLYRQALALNPQESVTRCSIKIGLGKIAVLRKDYTSAVSMLEEAIKIQPDSSETGYLLAEAYASTKNEVSCRNILTGLAGRDPGRIEKAESDPVFKAYREKEWFKKLRPVMEKE